MSTGIQISFNGSLGPAAVDFSKTVSGFDGAVQNAMVNLGTHRDSDKLFPDRGTDLFKAATVGPLVDEGERQHATALAAEITRLFMMSQNNGQDLPTDDSRRFRTIRLEVRDIDLKKIVFNASFVNVNGESRGQPLTQVL